MTERSGTLAIIPARRGSERFPKKNTALLHGRPLVAHAVEVALKSDVFEAICVSSDDDEVLAVASEYGGIDVLRRPPELATSVAQIKDVCRYLVEHYADKGRLFSAFAILLPTSPLRSPEDIRSAYDLLVQGDANFVISVTPFSHPPQRAVWAPQGYLVPYYGMEMMKPAQRLDGLFRHDGSIIFARTEAFLDEKEYWGTRALPFFVRPENAVDIDNPIDLEWAEFLLDRHRPSGDDG